MKPEPIPLLGPAREVTPYQKLATAVIERALLDATRPHLHRTAREGARAFLAGSVMFHHWCEVAGLDPGVIRIRATCVMREQ